MRLQINVSEHLFKDIFLIGEGHAGHDYRQLYHAKRR